MDDTYEGNVNKFTIDNMPYSYFSLKLNTFLRYSFGNKSFNREFEKSIIIFNYARDKKIKMTNAHFHNKGIK